MPKGGYAYCQTLIYIVTNKLNNSFVDADSLVSFVGIHYNLRHQAVNLARVSLLEGDNSALSREGDTRAEAPGNKLTDKAAAWSLQPFPTSNTCLCQQIMSVPLVG